MRYAAPMILALGCLVQPDENDPRDRDGDGFAAAVDCDDGHAGIYPGAPDVLGDGADADCDGEDGGEPVSDLLSLHSFVVRLGTGLDTDDSLLRACDTDGDGIDNIVFRATKGAISLLHSPIQPGSVAPSSNSRWMVAGDLRGPFWCEDFTGDGRSDLASLAGDSLLLWRQPRRGSWSRTSSLREALQFGLPAGRPSTLWAGEVRARSSLDLVVSAEDEEEAATSFWLVDGGQRPGPLAPRPRSSGPARMPFHASRVGTSEAVLLCEFGQRCAVVVGYPFDGRPLAPFRVATVESPNEAEATSVLRGDFDGDGAHNDLVMVGEDSGLHFYDRLGDQVASGSVTPSAVVAMSTGRVELVRDIDADGVDDLLVSVELEDGSTQVRLLSVGELREGRSAELLTTQFEAGFQAHFTSGDFDGDGQADLAFMATSPEDRATLGVYLSSQAP